MIRNIYSIFSVIIIFLALTSCFSTYPIQKKFPCEETTTQEKLSMIENAYNSIMKPKNLVITEKGVGLGKRSYEFDQINYVRAKTKTSLTGRKYWIQIRESNGEMNAIYLEDFAIMEKANNALMCLTDLQENNGRPKEVDSNQNTNTSKYDELKKLKELLDSGAITQEEYEKEKEKILNK